LKSRLLLKSEEKNMLQFFQQFPEVLAVMSEKKDGSMKVFPERLEENRENREKFFEEQGIEANRVVSAEIVHKTNVEIITAQNISHNRLILGTDALITKENNLFLSVTIADCLAIFFYDPAAKVIGIIHAGWKGLIDGVVDKTLETLKNCGARTENIFAAFGPSIQKCHFEIQADILPQFAKYEKYVFEKDGKTFVDLEGIAKNQLQMAGIQEMNIETSNICTFCEKEKFFSYRRNKPEKIQAMAAVVGMK
jgi:YfiH family protein